MKNNNNNKTVSYIALISLTMFIQGCSMPTFFSSKKKEKVTDEQKIDPINQIEFQYERFSNIRPVMDFYASSVKSVDEVAIKANKLYRKTVNYIDNYKIKTAHNDKDFFIIQNKFMGNNPDQIRKIKAKLPDFEQLILQDYYVQVRTLIAKALTLKPKINNMMTELNELMISENIDKTLMPLVNEEIQLARNQMNYCTTMLDEFQRIYNHIHILYPDAITVEAMMVLEQQEALKRMAMQPPPVKQPINNALDTQPEMQKKPPAATTELEKHHQWIKAQPGTNFMLQLMATTSEDKLKKFIKQYNIKKQAHYFKTDRDGENWYCLVYGNFSSREAAESGKRKLHWRLRKNKPWLRTVESAQQTIID